MVGASNATGGSHHADDGHHSSAQISCDAATATSTPGHGQVMAMAEVSVGSAIEDPAPARVIEGQREDAKLAGGPPLFLLHASFLI